MLNKLRVKTFFKWVCILCSFQTLIAQPIIDWQYTYGGSSMDIPEKMIETTDGGYAICGWTFSNDGIVTGTQGGGDIWIVKLDRNGILQWQKPLGSLSQDIGKDIIQTQDGGYLAVGDIFGDGGNVLNSYGSFDIWVVKLDAGGTVEWEQNYGGTANDRASAVKATSDGNFLIVGHTFSNDIDVSGLHPGLGDMWIIKINSAGTILWQKTLGGDRHEEGFDMVEADNGDYLVVGRTYSHNNGDVGANHPDASTNVRDDAWVVRLNPNTGAKIWAKCYGGSLVEEAWSIVKSTDGNFVIAGRSNSHDGDVTGSFGSPLSDMDNWVFKIDNNGTLLWQRRIGGRGQENEAQDSRIVINKMCDDGFMMVTGSTSSVSYDKTDPSPQDNNNPIWMVRLAADGSVLWDRVVGSIGGNHYHRHNVITAGDGSYLVSTYTDNGIGGDKTVPNYSSGFGTGDIWLVKLAYTFGFENTTVCFRDSTSFTDTTTNTVWNTSWRWDFGDPASGISNTSILKNPKHAYTAPGNYQAMQITTKDCMTDTVYHTVVVNNSPTITANNPAICKGDTIILNVAGSITHTWSTGATTASITVYPTTITQYIVTGTNGICTATISTTVTIDQQPIPDAGPDLAICPGSTVTLNASGGASYAWIPNPSLSSITIPNPEANPTVTTTYTVIVSNGACSESDAVTITISTIPSVDAGNNVTISKSENTILSAIGSGTYSWTPLTGLSCTTCQNPIANPDITTMYYVLVTDGNGCTNIDSVLVTIEEKILCQELYIPTAFSPNEDGQNDMLYIEINCIKKMKFIIYDRWGEKVFETDEAAKGWDGKYNGMPLDASIFVYDFKIIYLNNREEAKWGNITLLK